MPRHSVPSAVPARPRSARSTLTGIGFTLGLHLLLLAIGASVLLPALQDDADLDALTVTEAAVDEAIGFEELVDLSTASDAGEPPESVTMAPVKPVAITADSFLGGASETSGGQEDSDGKTGDGLFALGTSRLLQPGNAVSKGRFAAWTIPIARAGEVPPKPGDAPKPKQPYFIVVQLQLPDHYRTYPITDLYGQIEGTDGYRQKIPEPRYTFYYDLDSKLQQVTRRSRLPVRDHTVQVLIRVPGAQGGVNDEIELGAKRLDESETLTIEFADPRREPQS